MLAEVPRGTPCDMNDLIEALLARGRRLGVYPVSEGAWLDMGSLDPLRHMLDRFGEGERG